MNIIVILIVIALGFILYKILKEETAVLKEEKKINRKPIIIQKMKSFN